MSNKPFLLDEEKLSKWAYQYCLLIKDDPEIRELITDEIYIAGYEIHVKKNYSIGPFSGEIIPNRKDEK